jgi:hypothetical protein
MTFDVVHVDPDPYSGVLLLVLMWGIPTLILAVRGQSSDRLLRERLLVGASVLMIAAVPSTLDVFDFFQPEADLFSVGVTSYALSLPLAGLAFHLLGITNRRNAIRG